MDDFLTNFIWSLRQTADAREREGANTARTYRAIADDLEEAARRYYRDPITVAEGVEFSGLSKSTVQRIRREMGGTVRRGDLQHMIIVP